MADGNDPALQQKIFDAYSRLQVENYCIVASSVLLFFDVALTFQQETQRIWKRKFTGATFVYLFTRYVALAERITLMVSLFLVTVEDKRCVPVLRLDDALTDLSYASIGAFTGLRLYGIYGKAGIPVILIALVWIGRLVIAMYLQITYVPLAFGPPLFGCGALFTPAPETVYRLSTAANALVLASDCLLVSLTWVRTVGIRKLSMQSGLRTPLSTLLLRDGTVYFTLILIIQVFAIVSSQVGSSFVLFSVWVYFAQVFTVIFLYRFMLNLRGVFLPNSHEQSTVASSTAPSSTVRFSSSIVGNMGAPLDSVFSIELSPVSTMPSKETARDEYQLIALDDWEEYGEEACADPLRFGLGSPPDGVEPVDFVPTEHYMQYYNSRGQR